MPGGVAQRKQEVVDVADYLRETIAELDDAIHELRAKRAGLAIRLAALDASADPKVQAAAEDYERRVEANRPYDSAEDAGALITEAARRFSPQQ